MENRVANILKRRGKSHVKKNQILHDRFGNVSEIDIVYGRYDAELIFSMNLIPLSWQKTYVECKNYNGRPVPLSDVAKFKEVLQLNDIPISRYSNNRTISLKFTLL